MVEFSLALLFGVIMFFLLRGGVVKWGPAVVAVLFGFSLASTGAAEPIQDMLDSVSDAISDADQAVTDAPADGE